MFCTWFASFTESFLILKGKNQYEDGSGTPSARRWETARVI